MANEQLRQDAYEALQHARALVEANKVENALMEYLRAEDLYHNLYEEDSTVVFTEVLFLYKELTDLALQTGSTNLARMCCEQAGLYYLKIEEILPAEYKEMAGKNYLQLIELMVAEDDTENLNDYLVLACGYYIDALHAGQDVSGEDIRHLASFESTDVAYDDSIYSYLAHTYSSLLQDGKLAYREQVWDYARLLVQLGDWHASKAEVEQAAEAYLDAVKVYGLANHEEQPRLQPELAHVLVQEGMLYDSIDYDRTLSCYEGAASLYQELKTKREKAKTYEGETDNKLAYLYHRLGVIYLREKQNRAKAFENLRQAIPLWEKLVEDNDECLQYLGDAYFYTGLCLISTEEKITCVNLLRKARDIFAKINDQESFLNVQRILSSSFHVDD